MNAATNSPHPLDKPKEKKTSRKSYKLKEIHPDISSKVANIADCDLLHRLLYLRGIDDEQKSAFLKPDFEKDFHDPFLLKDMDKTVARMIKAIETNEHILIYSDYDADGLPGAAIMKDFFNTIGYKDVSFFMPDRHVEGFGLHAHILDEYLGHEVERPVTLIMTIDCGISDVEPVKAVSAMGRDGAKIDIIVTDHHLPGPVLPDAFAIVNPKQADCKYPEKMLCGAAVAYKIVCGLVTRLSEMSKETSEEKNVTPFKYEFPAGYTKWLLDLVGIATMSDMVPLKGENRLLAYYGLIVLKKTKRPGILALCRTNLLDPRNIAEDDIAFTMAPRINVASRLSDPRIAFNLLSATNYDEAMQYAKDLNNTNTKRKTMVAHMMKQAHALVKDINVEEKKVLIVGNPDWKPPVLGLVATQLIKAYGKPTFVWGRSDDGSYKGSARSNAGIDLVKIMYAMPDEFFINKGGHAQSGGFTVHPDHIFDFDQKANEAFDIAYGKPKKKKGSNKDGAGEADGADSSIDGDNPTNADIYEVDAVIDVKDVNSRTFAMLGQLSPCGVDNPKPLFAIKNFNIKKARLFGKTEEHLELESFGAGDGTGYGSVKAIQFFYADSKDFEAAKEALLELQQNKHSVLIGHIEKNFFRGAGDIRVKLVDII